MRPGVRVLSQDKNLQSTPAVPALIDLHEPISLKSMKIRYSESDKAVWRRVLNILRKCEHGCLPGKCEDPVCVVVHVMES